MLEETATPTALKETAEQTIPRAANGSKGGENKADPKPSKTLVASHTAKDQKLAENRTLTALEETTKQTVPRAVNLSKVG